MVGWLADGVDHTYLREVLIHLQLSTRIHYVEHSKVL